VHRIGRTARAGASGQAIALVAPDEVGLLRAIERTTRQKIEAEDRRANPTIPLNDRATPVRQQRGGRGGQPQQAAHRQPKREHGGRNDRSDRQESRGTARPAQEQRNWVKPMGDGARKRPSQPGGSQPRGFLARGR
jgi:ATP-dependent RNA helicase RhlE